MSKTGGKGKQRGKNKISQYSCSRCSVLTVHDELKRAIEYRDAATVCHILNCSYDLSTQQVESETLLHKAFHNTSDKLELQPAIIQILKLLLDKGANVNAKNNSGNTILNLAIQERMTEVINFLLDRKADLHMCDSSGNTLLHFTITSELFKSKEYGRQLSTRGRLKVHQIRSAEFIRWMVLKGLDVDYKNNSGDNSLHLAAKYNLLHAMPVLLKHSRDVQITNNDGKTAFQIFVQSKIEPVSESIIVDIYNANLVTATQPISMSKYEPEMFEKFFTMFMNKGFPANLADKSGNTPLHYALKINKPRIVRSLLNNFTNFNARDEDGNTVLHIVIDMLCTNKCYLLEQDYKEIARALWSKGSDIHIINNRGLSPFAIAMKSKKDTLLKMFTEYGTEFYHRYKDNLLIYFSKIRSVAHVENDHAVLDMLLSQGWKINAKDTRGMTLLHVAAQLEKGSEEFVSTLIGRGAHVDIMDNDGCLPLQAAIVHQNSGVMKKLVIFGADINDNTYVFSVQAYKSALAVIISHLIKLQVAKMHIDEKLKHIRSSNPKLKGFAQSIERQCLIEAASLRNYKIADNLSLYDLLHVNRRSTSPFVKNEKLKGLVSSAVFEKRFPMYQPLILGIYHQGFDRRNMLEPAKEALHKFINVRLPEFCLHEIFYYLSNVNLRALIEAADDSKCDNLIEIEI